MNMLKKSLAMFLALCMLFSAAPMTVFAEEIDSTNPIVTEATEETTAPAETVPETTVALETVPETTVALETVPQETVPQETVPQETVPQETVPQETVSQETAPQETVPQETVPQETVPQETVPQETVPQETVSQETVPETVPGLLDQAPIGDQLISGAPVTDILTNSTTASVPTYLSDATAADFDVFVRAFALDCGRLYFSVNQIKAIIDVMAQNHYTHLTLAFGNSGFRFLLDDMTVGNCSSDAVKAAIKNGNTSYVNNDGHYGSSAANTCLTQSEMTAIISYAKSKGISIIPALNSPGHMNTIVYAMKELGISNAGYPVTSTYNSESTININDATVTEFVTELIQKYITYFKGQGCTMFNLGADEFANDPTDDTKLFGFSSMSTNLKNAFINYVNGVAGMISDAGMIPMMFNDGYAWSDANFNKDIVVCYWTSGSVSSQAIANAGHNVINNSQKYYYVLGEPSGSAASNWCSYASATNGVNNVPVTTMVDSGNPGEKLVGAQMWLWCDYTNEEYTEDEVDRVKTLISTLATNNPTYFVETRELVQKQDPDTKVTVSGYEITSVEATPVAEADLPAVENASKVVAWDVTPYVGTAPYMEKGTVTLPVPEGWNIYALTGFYVENGEAVLVKGTEADGYYTFDMPHFSVSGLAEVAEDRTITVAVNSTVTDRISGYSYTEFTNSDPTKASVKLDAVAGVTETTVSSTKATQLEDGATYIIRFANSQYALTSNQGGTQWSDSDNLPLAFESYNSAEADNMWTLEASGKGYKIKCAAGYLNLGKNAAWIDDAGEVFTLSYRTGWAISDGTYNMDALGGGVTAYYCAGGWPNSGTRFDLYKVTTATEASTDVTFTGLAVGTTTVSVGHVTYTVNVTAEDLSTVSLTYHPWLSNYSVHANGTGAANCNDSLGVANPQYISAAADGVYSENGAVFADFAWDRGDWRWEDGDMTVYWKATVLPERYKQEGNAAEDCSMKGTDFTYIRYWGGEWSYSSDRETWTALQDTDEVCAYYLQETEVTEEVDVFVKDWAFTTENAFNKANRGQKALSFAVVYPGGTMNPSEEDIYANSTLIYWDNLADLGFLRVGVHEYKVSKITYTLGARRTDSFDKRWQLDDSIVWQKSTVTDANGVSTTWYDETVCWDPSYGTEPVVNGQDLANAIYAGNATSTGSDGAADSYNGTWGANDAVLILIYLEPVVTEDSLTVIYYDERFGDILHTYPITVNSVGDVKTTFLNGIGQVTTTNGITTVNTNVKPGEFVDAEGNTVADRINVGGYGIVNNRGVVQRFQTDLTQIPNAIGKYDSELYSYTGSKISDDGKTLYLYYNINPSVLKPNFVIDFGLPFTFNLSDVTNTPDEVDKVTASARHGSIYYDEDSKVFTYKPDGILDKVDIISINILFEGASATSITNVGVTPATTVYYEESVIDWDSNWDEGDSGFSLAYQETEQLAAAGEQSGKVHEYGYDPAYANTTGASSGVSATTDIINATGTFTFTGTGFQLYANSNTGSGIVSVYSKGGIQKIYTIDTALRVPTTAQNGSGISPNGLVDDVQTPEMVYYGLPVVSETNLPFGTYVVTIRHTADKATGETKPVAIDGVRIFNTVPDTTVFTVDEEDRPNFYELRDVVLKAVGADTLGQSAYINDPNNDRDGRIAAVKNMAGQVYNALLSTDDDLDGDADISNTSYSAIVMDTDGKYSDADVQDLLDNGPKNELYLYPGQSLAFSVTTNRVMQLGLKSPVGNAEFTIKVKAGEGEAKTLDLNSLSTTVDMFYKIADKATAKQTYTVTISVPETATGVLSVTTLKICDDPSFSFNTLTQEDIENALLGIYGLDEVENPFVDVVEDDFFYNAVLWAVEGGITNGMDDTHFIPTGMCNRAQIVTFLWRAMGKPAPTTTVNPFVDVTESDFFYDAVLWAHENGITNGVDATHFDPTGECNRAQAVTFLWRAVGEPESTADVDFTDVQPGQFYSAAVAWAFEKGITNGMGDGTFGVLESCNRAQVVTFLYRALAPR